MCISELSSNPDMAIFIGKNRNEPDYDRIVQLFLPVFINRMIGFKIIFELISDFYHTCINLVATMFIKTGNNSIEPATNALSHFI